MTGRGRAYSVIAEEIRTGGPMTVARFMELALYGPSVGYYMTAAQRSGRRGDFYTSVDTGPLFGALLARLLREAWRALDRPATFDCVEHAAGNGRLTRDVLDALAVIAPDCYDAVTVTLIERSPDARATQVETLGRHMSRASQADRVSPGFQACGIVLANELLDALPYHRVVSTGRGLREMYVALAGDHLTLVEGPLSTPELEQYFGATGCRPAPGGVADVSVEALAWCRAAAAALHRGYALLIDYGRPAGRLYGDVQAGTLRTFRHHRVDAANAGGPGAGESWLALPGESDITAHVDWTAVESAFASHGLVRLAFESQGAFLAALDLMGALGDVSDRSERAVRTRLSAAALLSPEGLGGSHQALLLAAPRTPPLPLLFAVDAHTARPRRDRDPV